MSTHEENSINPLKSPESDRLNKGIFLWGFVLLGVLLAVFGIFLRERHIRKMAAAAQQASVQIVQIVRPVFSQEGVKMALPGETQAFIEAPIYAQANGYLKSWAHDIGDKVKQGDELGMIDTPALDQQHDQAIAAVKQAQAALTLSESTYRRYAELLSNKVVSAQDYDNQRGDYEVKKAAAANAEANLRQIEALQTFKTIKAPFDGIISARNTDIGALINSTSSTPLFTVSQIDPLRVYVNVPQTVATSIKTGQKAEISFDTFPGHPYSAEVIAVSGAIDPKTRTMLVELKLPNLSGTLLPGSYCTVRFNVADNSGRLRIPASTLLFRSEGASVGVVVPGDKVQIRKITIDKDLGDSLEVSEGLSALDRVILNPSDSLREGDSVSVMHSSELIP
jgi:RND family efflux transporter MFP subunit